MKFEQALPYLRQGRDLRLNGGLLIDLKGLYQITAKDMLEGDFEVLAKEETVTAWMDMCEVPRLKGGKPITIYPSPAGSLESIVFTVTYPMLR